MVLTEQEYDSILKLLNVVETMEPDLLLEMPAGAFKRAVAKIKNAAVVY